MYVIWIANILVIFAMAFLIGKKQTATLRRIYWPAFVVKIAAGVALGLVYKYYYAQGDTFPYFYDAVTLADLARRDVAEYISFLWTTDTESPVWRLLNIQQPRAVFLSKTASIFSLLCSDNYWIIASYFSFMSFLASWFLLKEITRYDDAAFSAAAFALLFFPSIVFWTSGLIKESLAMTALYLIVIVFLRLWRPVHVSARAWVVVIISTWILWNLKYYYLAVLFPVMVTSVVYRMLERRFNWRFSVPVKVVVWLVLFLVPLGLASIAHPNFYPERFLQVIVDNYNAFVTISDPEELITYHSLSADPASIVAHAPKAFFSGVFRPFIWETSNPMQLIAAIENLVLMVLAITAIAGVWKRERRSRFHGIGWIVLSYCFLLCVFLALSTPNLGTLSRYRVGFLPFLVMILSYESILFRRIISNVQAKIKMLFKN